MLLGNKMLGISWIYFSDNKSIFTVGFAIQKTLNRDPTVWLDGAGPPEISLIMSLTYSVPTYYNSF
jgi:hypothetical protein